MAATLKEIKSKLDLALAGRKEIKELKEKQRLMEKENSDLRKSLEVAYKSIATLTEQADTQQKMLSKLTEDVNKLTQVANGEKEHAIKLESHSRRNNLIFYNIPEVRQESSATTETLLYTFLEQNLDMAEEETNEIPIEWVHHLDKIREDNKSPPIITKFSFHKDKEHILSSARTLAGTNYGISQDFPREIVEIRKGLVKVMKEEKKKGKTQNWFAISCTSILQDIDQVYSIQEQHKYSALSNARQACRNHDHLYVSLLEPLLKLDPN